jgi:anthranilate synthase component 2
MRDAGAISLSKRDRPVVCLIDAFDSFVYVIEQYLGELGAATTVIRSGPKTAAALRDMKPDAIVLGPGPGTPEDSGHVELVQAFGDDIPILGVCLGHQAIAVAYGGDVVRAEHIMHGKRSSVSHDSLGIYREIPTPVSVTRYHSLVVDRDTVPDCLEVTSTSDDDGYVMGLRHRALPIESVQFHPESVTTDSGMSMLSNFFDGVGLRLGASV